MRGFAGVTTGGASEADLCIGFYTGSGASGNFRGNFGISNGTLLWKVIPTVT